MPFLSLGEFLADLEDIGELERIRAQVDPVLEMGAITDRVCKASPCGGSALLFENLKNAQGPIVTNLLGNPKRLSRCLAVPALDAIPSEFDRRLNVDGSNGWVGNLLLGPGPGILGRWGTKTIKSAPCQQVVRLGRDVNLWELPVPRCWPNEQCPVIGSSHLVTRHCETGRLFYCQSPMVVVGPHELAWYDWTTDQKDVLNSASLSKQNLPIAISLGGDPILELAASVPGIKDSRSFAGFLRQANMEVVRCRTNELEVPAGAEFVIEGYVDAANSKTLKPVTVARGNARYVQRELPLIQVTAVTHRSNPIFPASIVSPPPCEETWIAQAVGRILVPILKQRIPELVDLHQPISSANRNILFASIRKSADHDARRILHALWGLESIGQTKMIVIVDADQDVRNENEIWFHLGTQTCPNRDFIFSDGLARDDDYTPLTPTLASRIGIDATRKRNNEASHPWPDLLKMPDEIVNGITQRWSELGLKCH